MSYLDDLIQKAQDAIAHAEQPIEALALEVNPNDSGDPPPTLTDEQREALSSIAEDLADLADMLNSWLKG